MCKNISIEMLSWIIIIFEYIVWHQTSHDLNNHIAGARNMVERRGDWKRVSTGRYGALPFIGKFRILMTQKNLPAILSKAGHSLFSMIWLCAKERRK